MQCLQHLNMGKDSANDWIIALTDGDDNCSGANRTAAVVERQLSTADVGVVVIGIGSDVQTHVNKSKTF